MSEPLPLPVPFPEFQPAAPSGAAEEPVRWSLGLRIAFRFCLCYFLPFAVAGLFLFAYFFDLTTSRQLSRLQRFDPWFAALPWICAHIFRVQRKLAIFPDSDLLAGYLQHLFEGMLALAVTAVWSVLDWKRSNYRRLYAGFALFLRFSLAIVLFSYGFDKVFPFQFLAITTTRLSQQVGNLDLFNMLWVFMAASTPYTIFSGSLEVLAGLLLIIPRLETLGALLAVSVLTNVFVLNMDYGVPVKIISSHLLLVALFLAAPALPRMVRLLVLGQAVPAIVPPQLSSRRTVDRAVRAGVAILGVFLAVISGVAAQRRYAMQEAAAVEAQKLPYFGLWVVDTFSVPNAVSQSLFTAKLQKEYRVGPGTDHWLAFSVDTPKRITLELRDGIQDGVDLALDPRTGAAELSDGDDPDWKAMLTFQSPANDQLTIKGTINGIPVSSTWHRRDLSGFRLVKEKFRWISPG
jgi:uncharacterized membrane protein YphA (DoxX/SURF4 family)